MSVVADIVTEQTMKREKFKAIYKEILEAELVPRVSEDIMIKRFIRERVIEDKNSLDIEFHLFSTFGYRLSLMEYINEICYKKSLFHRFFDLQNTFFMKQVKYQQYNLKGINNFSFIVDLTNYRELATEIFKETNIPQQLIKLGKNLGCESEVSYPVDEGGISTPTWVLNW